MDRLKDTRALSRLETKDDSRDSRCIAEGRMAVVTKRNALSSAGNVLQQ